ncbi:MAG: hypothetical protein QG656_371 [Candidatus Hydrogenedentes bacterium]|nr:hypothetical protein [Candidatus Hydrogenedentota bacterium]
MADVLDSAAVTDVSTTPAPVVDAAVESASDAPLETSADGRVEPPHPLEQRNLERKPARKDRATPKDVPTIQALSGVIRELTAKDEKDAPRVAELRKKLREALEIESPAPKAAPVQRAAPMPVPQPVGEFADAEPNIDQFANEADQYAAYVRALARYDRKREDFEAKRQDSQRAIESHQRAQMESYQRSAQDYMARVTTAKTTKYPDWDRVVTDAQIVTPVMTQAILSAPNGEDFTYFLASHPDILDDLVLSTAATPVDDTSVALMQRRLNARLAAGTTGAAPTKPVVVAPRPPTPVRTGSMMTGETPPSDDADLDEHRKFYGVGARRRR